jgi:polyisoprenoid-binding protein YceI
LLAHRKTVRKFEQLRRGDLEMATAAVLPVTATQWNLDPAHSSAEFKVKHMMISNVKGSLRGLKGMLSLDESTPANSKIQASVDVSTISTGDDQRDGHLKSADFFDATKFPEMTFQSTAVKRNDDGEYYVTGNLTIHGVTKNVTLAVEGPGAPGKDPWGNTRIGISATTKINREDFGLTWNSALETGGVLVGKEVMLTIDAQFIKQQ